MTRFEELRLIALCLTGDNRSAYEQLIAAHQDSLRRFIFNLTLGDVALTDDLMQDTFIKAYLSLSTFRGMSRFKTWLYRIAINEFNNNCRKRSELLIEDYNESHLGVAIEQHRTDARIDVQKCLAVLTPNERIVVELFFLEDLPIKKISEITSFPDGTIKSHIARAKAKMYKVFN